MRPGPSSTSSAGADIPLDLDPDEDHYQAFIGEKLSRARTLLEGYKQGFACIHSHRPGMIRVGMIRRPHLEDLTQFEARLEVLRKDLQSAGFIVTAGHEVWHSDNFYLTAF